MEGSFVHLERHVGGLVDDITTADELSVSVVQCLFHFLAQQLVEAVLQSSYLTGIKGGIQGSFEAHVGRPLLCIGADHQLVYSIDGLTQRVQIIGIGSVFDLAVDSFDEAIGHTVYRSLGVRTKHHCGQGLLDYLTTLGRYVAVIRAQLTGDGFDSGQQRVVAQDIQDSFDGAFVQVQVTGFSVEVVELLETIGQAEETTLVQGFETLGTGHEQRQHRTVGHAVHFTQQGSLEGSSTVFTGDLLLSQGYQTIKAEEVFTGFSNSSQDSRLVGNGIVRITTKDLSQCSYATLNCRGVHRSIVLGQNLVGVGGFSLLAEGLQYTELEVVHVSFRIEFDLGFPAFHLQHVTVDLRGLRVDQVAGQTNTLRLPYRAIEVQRLFSTQIGHFVDSVEEVTEILNLANQSIRLGLQTGTVCLVDLGSFQIGSTSNGSQSFRAEITPYLPHLRTQSVSLLRGLIQDASLLRTNRLLSTLGVTLLEVDGFETRFDHGRSRTEQLVQDRLATHGGFAYTTSQRTGLEFTVHTFADRGQEVVLDLRVGFLLGTHQVLQLSIADSGDLGSTTLHQQVQSMLTQRCFETSLLVHRSIGEYLQTKDFTYLGTQLSSSSCLTNTNSGQSSVSSRRYFGTGVFTENGIDACIGVHQVGSCIVDPVVGSIGDSSADVLVQGTISVHQELSIVPETVTAGIARLGDVLLQVGFNQRLGHTLEAHEVLQGRLLLTSEGLNASKLSQLDSTSTDSGSEVFHRS
ncbi:hypothetical protein [Pseudomonas phage vB_Pae-PA152]|nr:hypothetical protein [Pseudomonas phage vB_Pae-PA152]